MERLTRRFLTFDIGALNLSEPIRYERYYINDELRIQKKNNVYEKEILKDNVVISKEQISFDEFMGLKEKAYKEIIRDSYLYLEDDRISIKKYYGMYEGLIRVEIEFQSIDELKKYEKEKWMNKEITLSPLAFDRDLSKLDRELFLRELGKIKH